MDPPGDSSHRRGKRDPTDTTAASHQAEKRSSTRSDGRHSSSSQTRSSHTRSSYTQSDTSDVTLSTSSRTSRKLRPVKFKGQSDDDTMILVFTETPDLSSFGRSSSSVASDDTPQQLGGAELLRQSSSSPQPDFFTQTYPDNKPKSHQHEPLNIPHRVARSDSREHPVARSDSREHPAARSDSRENPGFRARGLTKAGSKVLVQRSVSDSGSGPNSRSIHDSVSSKGTIRGESMDALVRENEELKEKNEELQRKNKEMEKLNIQHEKLETGMKNILSGESVQVLRSNLELADDSLQEQSSLIQRLNTLVMQFTGARSTTGVCENCGSPVAAATSTSYGEGARPKFTSPYPSQFSSLESTDTILTSASGGGSSFGIKHFTERYSSRSSFGDMSSSESDSEEYNLIGDDEREAAMMKEESEEENTGDLINPTNSTRDVTS